MLMKNTLAKKSYIGTHVFLIILGAVMVLPLVYMVANAFKPYDEFFIWPPRFWVRRPTLANFTGFLLASSSSSVPFTRYLFNSVFVTVGTVGIGLVVGSMAAYALAKREFPGKRVIYMMNMAAFMFAVEVVQIPRFLVVNSLGLLDTYWALIIPLAAQPFMVFLMVQYMREVPVALIESATCDGANQWTVYTRIIMPLIKPALATVLILTFVTIWRDAFSPIIYIRTEALKTVPVAMTTIAGSTMGGWAVGPGRAGAAAAAAFLLTAPTIIIFVLLQRHVITTMAHSGIKE